MKLQLTSILVVATVFFGVAMANPIPEPCGGNGRRSPGGPTEDCNV